MRQLTAEIDNKRRDFEAHVAEAAKAEAQAEVRRVCLFRGILSAYKVCLASLTVLVQWCVKRGVWIEITGNPSLQGTAGSLPKNYWAFCLLRNG